MNKTEIKILLIEDNTADVIFLREALEGDLLNSFAIITVERLAPALGLLQKSAFDAILLDLGLPDSQGLDTFTRIHQSVPDIPTVILSGLRDDAFAQQAVHAGAQDYLTKDQNGYASSARAIRYAIERQKAEKAQRASQLRYQSLFENSPISIWEEDFSQARIFFDKLRSSGVNDLEEYFDNHPEAVKECSRLVKVLDVNHITLDLMEVENKSEILDELESSLNYDSLDTFKRELVSLANGELSFEGEETLWTKKQVEKNLLFNINVVPGYENTLGKVIVSIVDITGRKQAEKQIVQTKRLYATLSQVNQTIVRVKDRNDLYHSICNVAVQFGEFSLAWVGILDEASGEVKPVAANGLNLAQWPFQIVNIHQGDSKNGLVATAIHTSEVVTSEDIEQDKRTQFLHERFSEYDYHSSAVIPFRLKGKTIGMLSLSSREAGFFKAVEEVRLLEEMGLDISFALDMIETEAERKQAENALRKSEEKYRNLAQGLEDRVQKRTAEVQDLYDNAPNGYHSLDKNGTIVMINQTELNWLGYTREELVGVKTFRDLFTTQSQKKFDENFPRFKAQGWISDLEFDLISKDGSIFPVLLNATSIRDKNGELIMSRSTMIEITERRKAEIALRESRDELSAANTALEKAARMKDEFLASMSHELRTPLTGILGLSEALQLNIYGELNEKQHKAITTIEDSGRHLLELINDILDLSKIESGKLEPQFAPCSLADICQASLQLTKDMAQHKHQRVHYSAPIEPIIINADMRRVKQILVNLLSNAIKFTTDGGELGLDIQANEAEQKIKLSVWDKGIGIKPEDMYKLFKPFTQIDNSLAREYSGTGLGLSLVKRLVELHNGGIEMESALGEGSRFTVTLPWLREDTGTVQDRQTIGGQSSPEPVDGNSDLPLVMIADDNELLLEMLADFLESKQYRTVKVHSGMELIERAAELHPDLMLVDIQMPGMDGLETIRRIRAHKDSQIANACIIAITALAMPGDSERCLKAGANEYMSKPVRLQELASVIKTQIGKKQ